MAVIHWNARVGTLHHIAKIMDAYSLSEAWILFTGESQAPHSVPKIFRWRDELARKKKGRVKHEFRFLFYREHCYICTARTVKSTYGKKEVFDMIGKGLLQCLKERIESRQSHANDMNHEGISFAGGNVLWQ